MMLKKLFIWGVVCIITLNGSLSASWSDVGNVLESNDNQHYPFLETASERQPQKQIDKITLHDALSLALKFNSDLAASAWDVRSKEGAVLQAGLHPNPELAIEVGNFGGKDDLNGFDGAETTIGLSQLIELGGKRGKREHAASSEKDLAQLDFESKRLDIISDVTKAFIAVLVAQKRFEQAKIMTTLSESIFQAVVERVDAGKVSPVEKTRSSVERSTAQLAETNYEQQLEEARISLAAYWNGNYPFFNQAVGDLEMVSELPSLESLEALIELNPDVARCGTVLDKLDAERDLADSMAVPDLTVGLGVRNFQDTGNNAYVFSMEVPLPVFNRNQGRRIETSALFRKARFESEAVRIKIRSNLAVLYQRLSAAYAEVKVLNLKAIPAAQDVFRAVSTGYREGKVGFLEVLDAQRTLFETKGQYQTALSTYHQTKTDMERLISSPLKSIKPSMN